MNPTRKPLLMALGLALWLAQPVAHAATPAEQKIAQANQTLERQPNNHEAHVQLAMALAQRAREIADTALYAEADKAAARSLELAPGNLAARRAQIWILLGRHEFAAALEQATALNREQPDDLQTYAYLTDANIELGRYAAAEQSAQWLLDLRPGNIPGLTRAAYLRELFGDLDGSLDLMQQAYQRTAPTETENRAWLLTHMAHLHLLDGQPDRADALLDEAFKLFPGYHYALAQQARVRQAQGRDRDAVALLRRHVEAAPHPENFFYLGEALAKLGRKTEAAKVFAKFETAARAESASNDNANRELVFYYADHARRPVEALKISTLEMTRRQDVHTLDAHAWALYRNARYQEAGKTLARALAVGVRDPKLHFHAGMIALKTGKVADARQHLQTVLRTAPHAEFADAARQALRRAGGTLPQPT